MKRLASIMPVEPTASEAVVEQSIVFPLLQLLGYDKDNIVPKYAVPFQKGRKSGRPSEADFVVFGGKPHDRNSSVIVVEAKRASENVSAARGQAESYAVTLRAPFIILTNGVKLEAWRLRPTMENELLISIDIIDVATQFSHLESLIGKEATLAYARKIECDWAFTPLNIFHDYVTKHLELSKKYGSTTERRLNKIYDSNKIYQTSDLGFLYECRGAVITGSSGMGKTVAGYRIFRNILQDHIDTSGEIIPFHINLTDLGQENILEYALETIRSTYPALSFNSLESLLREKSVVIICDTFDQAHGQDLLAAEFRKLLTRYDKFRLVVLSRGSSVPDIGLPIYEILPLSYQEQREVAGDAWHLLYRIPKVAKILCESPLLLSLIIEHWRTYNNLPNNLAQLFQTWLDRILRPQQTRPSVQEMLLRAMTALAQADEQLSIAETQKILESIGLPISYLDDLVQRDAIIVQNRIVNFNHESLRDYLIALSISELSFSEAKRVIDETDLETDSLFPILLMNLFHDPNKKALLWRRLGATSLETVHSVVAFNSRDWYRGDLDPSRLQEFLTGVADGMDLIIESFLPQMRSAILRGITWYQTPYVCIAGEADSKSYVISFLPSSNENPRIIESQVDFQDVRHSSQSSGGPIDWMRGCTIGIDKVERVVLDLVNKGKLSGGRRWHQEVVCGWLRVLRKSGSYFDLPNTNDVLDISNRLELYTKSRFSYHGFAGHVSDEDVVDIIKSLHYLKQIGVERIDESDNIKNSESGIQQLSRGEIVKTISKIYVDAQHLYKEIVDENFQHLSLELRHANLFPARVKMRLEWSLEKWHIQKHWNAASDWDECGVDIIPEDEPYSSNLDELFDEMEKSYIKQGKQNSSKFLYCTGWGGIISDGNRRRRHNYESAIFRMAMTWISDDLRRAFEA